MSWQEEKLQKQRPACLHASNTGTYLIKYGTNYSTVQYHIQAPL